MTTQKRIHQIQMQVASIQTAIPATLLMLILVVQQTLVSSMQHVMLQAKILLLCLPARNSIASEIWGLNSSSVNSSSSSDSMSDPSVMPKNCSLSVQGNSFLLLLVQSYSSSMQVPCPHQTQKPDEYAPGSS